MPPPDPPGSALSRGRGSRPSRRVVAVVAVVAVAALAVTIIARSTGAVPTRPADEVVSVDLNRAVNHLDGTTSVGAGVDGLDRGAISKAWTSENIASMKSAGFGPLSYRLRTELGAKAWHWNSQGTWSDPKNRRGYWVSSSTQAPGVDTGVSYGYDLPRRGNSIDQANDDDYSRLTDGSEKSFWKSNPYLDPHFTHLDDKADPQWIIFALPQAVPVDTLRIAWGTPYATNFKVQCWVGAGDPIYPIDNGGRWQGFPTSAFSSRGGDQTVQLATSPVQAQFVRIQLTDSSGTAPTGSTDIRDRLGFAVRELYLGSGAGDAFYDEISHSHSRDQSIMYTSSTDPWHRAKDINKNYEQPSFQRVYESSLTKGQPLMVPAPALYGVPEDAAALLRYLRARNYPVNRIEIGEEPDGQLAQPEHYAELYMQVADALRRVDPKIQLGGPGYQTATPDWIFWPDKNGVKSWTGRFVSFLRAHNHLKDFNFFSFEWYPFDNVCADPAKLLAGNPAMLKDILARQDKAGLPSNIPKVMTEMGYSAFAGQPEVEMPGAIFDAETTASFFQLGGDSTYFYGLEPNDVIQEDSGKPCNSYGSLMLFQNYGDGQIRPVAAFYANQLVTTQWIQPGSGRHQVFTATSNGRKGQPLVTAYALKRPDGRLSVMLFNKDPKRSITVRLETVTGGKRTVLPGNLDLFQYSGKQYVWDPALGSHGQGFPKRDLPPEHKILDPDKGAVVTLPPMSISVVKTEAQ